MICVKILKVCIVLYVKCSTRESLHIDRGKSNAQVKGVLYKTIYIGPKTHWTYILTSPLKLMLSEQTPT
jgi:hypothetical protein